ncbi:MAG: hypothetical protein QNJ31_07890 [Candidatus Caenarcaniphilales bacterium]|nr:hypothetical protein [Candidatus Caenarcaniphilales bacterium]
MSILKLNSQVLHFQTASRQSINNLLPDSLTSSSQTTLPSTSINTYGTSSEKALQGLISYTAQNVLTPQQIQQVLSDPNATVDEIVQALNSLFQDIGNTAQVTQTNLSSNKLLTGSILGLGSIIAAVLFRDILPQLFKPNQISSGMQNILDMVNSTKPLSASDAEKIIKKAKSILANAKSLEDLLPANDPLFVFWARTIGPEVDRKELLFNVRKAIALSLAQISSGMVPDFFCDMDGNLTMKTLSKVFDSNQKSEQLRMFLQMAVSFNNKLRGTFELAYKKGRNYKVDFEACKHLKRLGLVNDPNGIYELWSKEFERHINNLIKNGYFHEEALKYFHGAANYWANTARMGVCDTITIVKEWYNTWFDSKEITFPGLLGGIHTEIYGMRDVKNAHERLVNAVGIGNVRVVDDQLALATNTKELAALSRVLRDKGFADYLKSKSMDLRVNERKGIHEYVIKLVENIDEKLGYSDLKKLESRYIPVGWVEGFESKLASIKYYIAKGESKEKILNIIRQNFREINSADLEYVRGSIGVEDFPDMRNGSQWAKKSKLRDTALKYREKIANNKDVPPLDAKTYRLLKKELDKKNLDGAIKVLNGLIESCVFDVTIHAASPQLDGTFTPDRKSGIVEQGKVDLKDIFQGFFKNKKLSKATVDSLNAKGIDVPDFVNLIVNNASMGPTEDFPVDPKNKSVTVPAKTTFPNTLYLEIPFTKFDKGNIFHYVFSLYIQQFFGDSPSTDTKYVAATSMMNPFASPGQPRKLSTPTDMQIRSLQAADMTDFINKYENAADLERPKLQDEYDFRTFHPLAYVRVNKDGEVVGKVDKGKWKATGEYYKFIGGSSWSTQAKNSLKNKFPHFNKVLTKNKFEAIFHKNFDDINSGRIIRVPDCDYLTYVQTMAPSVALGSLLGFDSKDMAKFANNPRLYHDNKTFGYNSEFDVGLPFHAVSNGKKWGIEFSKGRKNIYHPLNWFTRNSPTVMLRGFQAGGGLLVLAGLGSVYLYIKKNFIDKNNIDKSKDQQQKELNFNSSLLSIINQSVRAGWIVSDGAFLMNAIMNPIAQPFSILGSFIGLTGGFLPLKFEKWLIPLSVALNMAGWAQQNAYWAKANLCVPTESPKHFSELMYENKNWANDATDVLKFENASDEAKFRQKNSKKLFFGGVDAAYFDRQYFETYKSLVKKNVPKFAADMIARGAEFFSMSWKMISNPKYLHDVFKPTKTRDLVRGKEILFPNAPHQFLAAGSLFALFTWGVSMAIGMMQPQKATSKGNQFNRKKAASVEDIPVNGEVDLMQVINSNNSIKSTTDDTDNQAQDSNNQADLVHILSTLSGIPPAICQTWWGLGGTYQVAFGSPATTTLPGSGKNLLARPRANGLMTGFGGGISVIGGFLGLFPQLSLLSSGLYSIGQGLASIGIGNENMVQQYDRGIKLSNAYGFVNKTGDKHIKDLAEIEQPGKRWWKKLWGRTIPKVNDYAKAHLVGV